MTSEFRRAHVNRTHAGDVFVDAFGVRRVVEKVWQPDDYIAMKVDGWYYRRGPIERSVLQMPSVGPRADMPSNWRLT